MLQIIVKKINSFHLNLYLTSDAQDSSSDTTSPVASLSGTSSNTNNASPSSAETSSQVAGSPGAGSPGASSSVSSSNTNNQPITAYIHDLTEIKTSANNNLYFNLQLQTEEESFRAVCYSPDKHKSLKAKAETSSPIKITNYQKKRNKYTSDDEIHMSKRTKLSDPLEKQSNSDVKPLNALFSDKSFSTVENVATAKVQQQVNLQGRITFQGNNETLIAKGKTLKKQEAYLTDDTASIRLVLWEDDIKKVTSGQSYQLMKVRIRLYNDAPYVTLNKQSTINPAELKITRSDDQEVKSEHELKTVLLPADGVQSITRYLSCNSCKTRIEEKDKKVLKCAQCGLSHLKQKCCTRIYAKAIFKTDKEPISLVLFDDKLKALYQLNNNENPKIFEQLTDEEIEELILEAEALLLYNSKNNIVHIKQKQEQ